MVWVTNGELGSLRQLAIAATAVLAPSLVMRSNGSLLKVNALTGVAAQLSSSA